MKIDEWTWLNNERLLWSSSRFLKTGYGLVEIWWECGPTEYLIGSIIDGVVYGNPNEIEQDQLTIVNDFKLFQNYPNPFNSYTTILFYLTHKGTVYFNIYDILGKLIYTDQYSFSSGGYNTFIWDGKDINNKSVPSGIYLYELSTGRNKMRRKMTINK